MVTFKVEGEGGMVTLFKVMKRSSLQVGILDGVRVPAKIIGYVEKGRAAEVPTFKELFVTGREGESMERLAA